MPKRRNDDETIEERWYRRMKKYQDRLKKRQCFRISYSEDEDDVPIEDHLEDGSAPIAGASAGDVPPIPGANDECVPSAAAAVDVENTAVISEIENPPEASNCEPDPSETIIEDTDPELLKALGEFETEVIEWGDNIHEDVAKRFQHVLQNGLKKEIKDEIAKKYLFPKNMSFSKAPTLNPEIASMLTEVSKNRDKRLLSKQEQLGQALSALGKAMTILLRKSPDIPEVLRSLNDAGKLLSDAHNVETDTRRSLISPLVDKTLIETFKDRKRDEYLFGDKLGDLVKNSRGIKKTGQFIQATSSSSSVTPNLNWRGPSSSRGRQKFHRNNGGAQRFYNRNPTRRQPPMRRQTGAFAPPAPTARRQPPAPPAARFLLPPPPPPPPPPPAHHQI